MGIATARRAGGGKPPPFPLHGPDGQHSAESAAPGLIGYVWALFSRSSVGQRQQRRPARLREPDGGRCGPPFPSRPGRPRLPSAGPGFPTPGHLPTRAPAPSHGPGRWSTARLPPRGAAEPVFAQRRLGAGGLLGRGLCGDRHSGLQGGALCPPASLGRLGLPSRFLGLQGSPRGPPRSEKRGSKPPPCPLTGSAGDTPVPRVRVRV